MAADACYTIIVNTYKINLAVSSYLEKAGAACMQFSINPWLFSGQFLDEWVSELLVVSDSFAGLTNATCIL